MSSIAILRGTCSAWAYLFGECCTAEPVHGTVQGPQLSKVSSTTILHGTYSKFSNFWKLHRAEVSGPDTRWYCRQKLILKTQLYSFLIWCIKYVGWSLRIFTCRASARDCWGCCYRRTPQKLFSKVHSLLDWPSQITKSSVWEIVSVNEALVPAAAPSDTHPLFLSLFHAHIHSSTDTYFHTAQTHTHTYTPAHTLSLTQTYTHTHTRTHSHTHMYTHTHTRTHKGWVGHPLTSQLTYHTPHINESCHT